MILFSAETEGAAVADSALAADISKAAENVEKVQEKILNFDPSSLIPGLIRFGIKIIVILLIWFIGKKLTKLILNLFEKTAVFNHFDISVTKFLAILIRWAMYFIMVCIILNYLNIGTASLVAVLGSAGLAVGLSLQGSLSNFAGSVILLTMKPFHVGDYIVTSEGEGTVKLIGLIYTTLETVDKKDIHIPNGTLSNTNITNVTANPNRLLSIKASISYTSDLKKAKALIEKMMLESEYVLTDLPFSVFVSSLGDNGVNLEGRCIVATENYWPATWYFAEKIKLVYDEEGIEIPYSQLDVHMK